jgi:hypothetical protein
MGIENALDSLLRNGRGTFDAGSKIYGVVPAIVTAVNDPKQKRHGMGMVQVYFPWLQKGPLPSDKAGQTKDAGQTDPNLINPWARCVMPNAGGGSGFYSVPQIGDEVVVGFEHGDVNFPYVLGSVWNGANNVPMPTTKQDKTDCKCHHPGAPTHKTPDLGPDTLGGDKGANKSYFWRSRSGNMMVLDDKEGTIRVQERTGNSVIQLEKDQIKVLQKSGDGIFVFAKDKIRLDCKDFEAHATNNISFYAKKNWGSKSDQQTTHECGQKFTATMKSETESNGASGLAWKSDQDIDMEAGTTFDATAGQNALIKSSSADFKVKSMMKVNYAGKQDVNITSKANIMIQGLMGVNFATQGEAKLNAGSMLSCKSMRINIQ